MTQTKIFVVDWQESMLKDDELTAYAKFLGMYLRTFMNGKNEMAWPSLARIVCETSISKNTVCRHLEILENAGWIARNRGSLGKNTQYTAVIPENGSVRAGLAGPEVVSERHKGSVRETLEVVSERDTNKQVNNQVITNSAKFDEFWLLYPAKKAKAEAKKKFNRLKPSEQLSAIANLKTRKWPDDHQFIPHPTTYINQKRWEDEVVNTGPTSPSEEFYV